MNITPVLYCYHCILQGISCYSLFQIECINYSRIRLRENQSDTAALIKFVIIVAISALEAAVILRFEQIISLAGI